MSFLAQAGYKTNEIISAMPGILNAAAAGQTDLATTADITSNILSGFGLEASKTADVADVLTKTFTSTNVDLRMLGESMKYLSPTAKTSGQSLEEMAAAVGILGNAGIQGSMAGTSLAMSLTRLASPSKEASELMQQLGFNAFDSKGNMLPLNQIIGKLSESTKDLTQQQKLHAISTIFGAESSKAMITLLEAGAPAIKDFTTELENAGGAAEEIATKQLDNLSGQLTILKSGIEAAAISIGTALLPAVKFLTSVIESTVGWFNGLNDGTKTAIAILTALAAVFLLLTGPLLILIAMIPSIVAGFAAIAGAVGAASSTLLIIVGVVVAVVAALVLIGIGLYKAYQKVDWFRNAVNNAWASIKSAWNTAVNFVKKVTQQVMSAVRSFIGSELSKIRKFWDENGKQIMSAVRIAFAFISSYIKTQLAIVQAVFRVVWPVIQAIVSSAWGIIKSVVSGGIDFILGLIKLASKIMTGDWKGAWATIKEIAHTSMDNIKSFLSSINLASIGRNIIQGLIKGITSAAGGLMKKAKSIADDLKNTISGALKINSPSRVMMAIGGYVGEGLAVGMSKSVGMVTGVANTLAGAAVPSIGNGSVSSIRRQTSQQGATTYNSPITVNLTYNGTGDKSDAYNIVNIIERELGNRTNTRLRTTGVKR